MTRLAALSALGLVHLPVALALLTNPLVLATGDPGHVARFLPALTSILALAAGASAAWAPGWRLAARLPAAGALTAACWCASSVFARPVLVAVARPAETWINAAAFGYRLLLVAVGLPLTALLALAGWRWLRSRRYRVASWAILAALAASSAFAAWALWALRFDLADRALVIRLAELDSQILAWLCYPGLWSLFLAIIWRGGWSRLPAVAHQGACA